VRVSINNWFDFQFVDNNNLPDQLHDFEDLVYELKVMGVEQSKSIYVVSAIKKLLCLGQSLLKVLNRTVIRVEGTP